MLSSTMMAFSQMTVHPGGTFNAHHTTSYSISGHLYNNGVHDHQSTSDLIFNGTTGMQEYVSNSTTTFHQIAIANPAGVEIDGIIEVNHSAIFLSGQFSLKSGGDPNSKIVFFRQCDSFKRTLK